MTINNFKYFTFFILILLNYQEPSSNNINKKKEDIKHDSVIFPDYLIGLWTPEYGEFGWRLNILDNNKFEEFFDGEGCGGYKGTYIRNNDKLVLVPEKNPDCFNENRKNNYECFLLKASDSLFSDWKLKCGKEEFFSLRYLKKENEILNVGLYKIKTVSPKLYLTTNEIFFRDGPGKDFKSLICSIEIVAAFEEKRNTLPKDLSLIVLGHTLEKDKIGKIENYWYYVKPRTGWHSSGCEKPLGWVFGEFIKKAED